MLKYNHVNGLTNFHELLKNKFSEWTPQSHNRTTAQPARRRYGLSVGGGLHNCTTA